MLQFTRHSLHILTDRHLIYSLTQSTTDTERHAVSALAHFVGGIYLNYKWHNEKAQDVLRCLQCVTFLRPQYVSKDIRRRDEKTG